MAVVENLQRRPSGPPFGLGPDASRSPEWQLVQRIIASPAFVRSALLTNFLLYVCDRKLRGKEDEITEHQIGVHALGRPDNYHPGEDNIVRNYARMLRKRLEEYFEGEGHSEDLRILIPRGQYVPTFERAQEAPVTRDETPEVVEDVAAKVETLPPVPTEAPTASNPKPINRRYFLAAASGVAVASGLGWFALHRAHTSAPAQMFQTFWTQIFAPNRECFVVTGDSGLVQLERFLDRDISLNEYVDGSLPSLLRSVELTSSDGARPVPAGPTHTTSTADLTVAVELDRIAMTVHATPKVRNARDMRMSDVKSSNGIFIGGPRANPWIELFSARSNFQMKFYSGYSSDHSVQSLWNKVPRAGEKQEYLNSTSNAPYTTYTMISFLPSVDEEGWVLLLQGQNLSGTGAAGEFVTNMNAIASVLQKAKRPDGSIGMFEVILETQVVGADAPRARTVVERYEPLKAS